MNFKERCGEKELLDGDNIPFADILQNMRELEFINSHLGGHKITLDGFRSLANKKNVLHVCEIGCGGGDNLVAIAHWCNQKNITLRVTGIDWKDSCIEVAKQNRRLKDNANWICSDYRHVNFDEPPDIIFSSLFCHHFRNEELVRQLKWMYQNCKLGFFINDLHRHWLAYHSIAILTAFFSKSYLVKNDAPLSVVRGFLKEEWHLLLELAGLKHGLVKWKWAFRHLILVSKKIPNG